MKLGKWIQQKNYLFQIKTNKVRSKTFFGMSLTMSFTISLILTSCSTRAPLIEREHKEKNSYFTFYNQQIDGFKRKIETSSFFLLRASLNSFLENISSEKHPQELLNLLPWTVVHGDFHVQQMAWRNGQSALDDFDTIDFGPIWIDLVRLEASAQLVAKSQSFHNFSPGACTKAYAATLLNLSKQKPPQAIGTPYPVDKKPLSNSLFENQDTWKKASTSVPSIVRQKIQTHASEKWPSQKIIAIRAMVDGVGSFNLEKYLLLLEGPNKIQQLW
jgi:hypothetical protein